MTTDLLKLTDEVTSDTQDKRLERLIEENSNEIRQALQDGKEYVLDEEHGITISAA
jgi:hypothetical protein